MAENKAELVGEYFKTKVRGFRKDLMSVVIFGSRASSSDKKEIGKASDVDLLLIFDKALSDEEEYRLSSIRLECAIKFKVDIDIVPLGKADFELNLQNRSPLFFEIWKKHRIVFDRDRYFSKNMEKLGALVRLGKASFNKWVNCWVVTGS